MRRVRTHSSALEKLRKLRLDGFPTDTRRSLKKDKREAVRLRFMAKKNK